MKKYCVKILSKIFFICFFFACFILGAYSAHADTIVSGSIDSDTTWTKAEGPYILDGYFYVLEGATLTIEPGTIVKLGKNAWFSIWGTLNATGTATDEIVFTSSLDDDYFERFWRGIYFGTSSISSSFRYIRIEYSTYGVYFEDGDFGSISNIKMEHNNDGIYLDQGNLSVSDSEFIDTKNSFTAHNGSTLSLRNILIKDISLAYGASITSLFNSFVTVDSSIVSNIGNSLAVYISKDSTASINNSILNQGDSNGISLYENATLNLSNSIVSNFNYAGINDSAGNIINIDHSTIKNNLSYGVSLFRRDSDPYSTVSIHNTGIYGNMVDGVINFSDRNYDLSNNWWGDATGPYDEILNPEGLGDEVFGDVTISPWLTTEPTNSANLLEGENNIPIISSTHQYKLDGVTEILESGIAVENTVVFKAIVSDEDNDQAKMQIEIKSVGESFDGLDILESEMIESGSTATITKTNIVEGDYYFRFRAVDSRGAMSAWKEFGTIGNTDFSIRSIPVEYFAQIKEASGGVEKIYTEQNIESTVFKTLPNDWIVKVFSSTNSQSDGGWVQIEDPTDASKGWINGRLERLVYKSDSQSEFEEKSSVLISTKQGRADLIKEVIRHYISNTDTKKSLYSGRDTINAPLLDQINFPEELVLAIIAQESGGSHNFNNEIVSFDYGHGIMQLTFHAWANEPDDFIDNKWDNRGYYSKVKIPVCRNIILDDTGKRTAGTDEYEKCYKNITEKQNNNPKPYDNYNHEQSNSKYKQYTNTFQSIYANIKDGLGILSIDKYRKKCPKEDIVISGLSFSCEDMEKIMMVWGYNGWTSSPKYNYLREISAQLANLSRNFEGVSYANTDKLIEKLRVANDNRKTVKVYSPVELSIIDSQGRVTGLRSGVQYEDIPNSVYSGDNEVATVFFPEGEISYKVVGSEAGTYGIVIESAENGEPAVFQGFNLPIIKNEVHTYKVDNSTLAEGGKGVTIQIDSNGDGNIERSVNVGASIDSIPSVQRASHSSGRAVPVAFQNQPKTEDRIVIPVQNIKIEKPILKNDKKNQKTTINTQVKKKDNTPIVAVKSKQKNSLTASVIRAVDDKKPNSSVRDTIKKLKNLFMSIKHKLFN